jgi:hypothetical protein
VEVNAIDRRLELVSTVLLALATVATAWAAYQSRQWTGQQALETSRATAARIAVNRAAAVANRQLQIDVATFIQWVDARELHRNGLADFYRLRFRSEFKPAFAAWLATRPFVNPAAPSTPFAMPSYRLKATAEVAVSKPRPRRHPSSRRLPISVPTTTCSRSCSSRPPSSSPGSAPKCEPRVRALRYWRSVVSSFS